MSTTIDAAIIKALVEHIGGDSSSIPDGTIDNSKISFVNCEWSVVDGLYRVKIPEGTKLDIGTCFKGSMTEGEQSMTIVFYCSDVGTDYLGHPQYTFSTGQGSETFNFVKQDTYWQTNLPVEFITEMPDNLVTGLFNLTGFAELSEIIKEFIERINRIQNQLKSLSMNT